MTLHLTSPQQLLLIVLLVSCGCRDHATGPQTISGSDSHASQADNAKDAAPEQPVSTQLFFQDLAEGSGISFAYQNDELAGLFSILESLGGGVAVFDLDEDGALDLVFTGGGEFSDTREVTGRPIGVFRNSLHAHRGSSSAWLFEDVSDKAEARGDAFYSHGVFTTDFNNDGFTDFLITGYGGVQLISNLGDGTLKLETEHGLNSTSWSSGAAWADVTNDGTADLFLTHYVNWSPENDPECRDSAESQRDVCSPRKFEGVTDAFFNNNGDGTFRDVSTAIGIISDGKGLTACAGDLNGDGRIDVYVANDTVRNFFYSGTPDGRLEEVGQLSGTGLGAGGRPDGSMGVDFADLNLDGLPDIWVTNYENESFALYRNYQNNFYQHVSASSGITAAGGSQVGWGTLCLDLDSDGDEDIVAIAGHVIRFPVNTTVRQQPLLFESLDGKRFRDVATSAGPYFQSPHHGRGLAAGDLDGDGDIDLVASNLNEPVAVLRNDGSNSGNYLNVRLVGTSSPRIPVGAVVTVTTDAATTLIRLVKSGASYASSTSPRLHFGLGQNSIVRLSVRWPSGVEQEFTEVNSNCSVTIVEQRDALFFSSSTR